MFRLFVVVAVVVLATVVPMARLTPRGRGQRDRDTMVGQVPVKKSPTSLLTNFTLRLIDVSKNKGCTGARCKSHGHSTDYNFRHDEDATYEDDPGDDDICQQPLDVGDCQDRYIRWYFNSNQGRCRRFRYSGCGGNENNFPTRRRCESDCNYYFDDGEIGGGNEYE